MPNDWDAGSGPPPDPRVRKDGRCARPGCNKLRPIVALKGKQLRELKRYAGNQAEKDPWCSTECCKHFHGCSVDADPEMAAQRSEFGRRGKAAGPLSNGQRIIAA